jgi:protein-tyrosine kinase
VDGNPCAERLVAGATILMSIIEQAARRLEQLERSGVTVPRRLVPEVQLPPATQERPSRGGKSSTVEVDLTRLSAAGYLVPGHPRCALGDDFRSIKRPLLKDATKDAMSPISRPNLVGVTSAVAGEGKTFCAINLALSIAAEVDVSVLLVDADVVRPSLLPRLGLDGDYRGLLDILSSPDLSVSEVMLRTNVPKLSLLPAGSWRGNATELLASVAMERLLDEFARRYSDRVVIFDMPPMLATTESRVLCSRVGQVVMVVEEDRTSVEKVKQAFELLNSVPQVRAILNKSSDQKAEGNGYGYGHSRS